MILIKNGRVINPKNNIDEKMDILIEKNIIICIEKNIELNDSIDIIDAKNCIVAPGLIDVHVHFRDPGFTYKEDIQSGSKAAARGGFTTVVCMANTSPVVDNEQTLRFIEKEAEKSIINVMQTATITKKLKGKELVDMKHLKECGAVGFSDDGIPIMDCDILLKAMKLAKKLDVPLSLHEEDPSLVINPGINHGKISQALGLEGTLKEAEEVMVARDCMLAISTKAKVNFQHISSGNTVDIIRFGKKMGGNITAEVTPHHFSITEESVISHKSYAKMNPPLRTENDRLKLIQGLKDDTIEIIATDHAPHSKEEKERGLLNSPSGIIGLETALSLGITNLVSKNYISLIKLLEKMTINPARLYNLHKGSLHKGAIADIVIFDPKEEWVVDDFYSKSANTPFVGQKLIGKVKYTICNGKIVYEDNINPQK
ncbi:MAG: dihydroorotase [Tissierellia bacterium]|nr:dihydroorotase [Tissierellia bacterium]MDD4779998.1 dihydroorotase [Tissierellia bacterium]